MLIVKIKSARSFANASGTLYLGTKKDLQAEVYRYDGGTNWTKASQPTPGQIQPGGTTGINLTVAGVAVINDLLY